MAVAMIGSMLLGSFVDFSSTPVATFSRPWMSTPDQQLQVSQKTISKLAQLRVQAKFVNEPGTIYNGMRPEPTRLQAEALVNGLIDRLQSDLPSHPSKKFVLTEFETTMDGFEPMDTEDRERFLRYLEEIMGIVGIESSDGLLNRWMYGLILGPMADRQYKKKAKE
jgi:Domain of unknown function (DUF4844)